MPLKFTNTEEARKLVLDESKKWRQALEKAKTSKDGAKEVAAAMVTATDTIVSAQVHTMDQVMDIRKEQGDSEGRTGEGQQGHGYAGHRAR